MKKKAVSVVGLHRAHLRYLVTLVLLEGWLYSFTAAMVVIVSMLSLIDPFIVKWIIDIALPRHDTRGIELAAIALFLIYGGRLAIHDSARYTSAIASQRLISRLRVHLMRETFRMPWDKLSATGPGDLVHRLERDIVEVCESGGEIVTSMWRIALTLSTVFTVMLFFDWRLTCALMPCIVAFALVRYGFRNRLAGASENVREQMTLENTFLHEVCAGLLQIQVLCCKAAMIGRLAELERKNVRLVERRSRSELYFSICCSLTIAIGITILFCVGGLQVVHGALTTGGLIAFYSFFMRWFDPLSNAIETTAKLHRLEPHVKRLREMKNDRHDMVPSSIGRLRASAPRSIEVERLSYRCASGHWALEECSVKAQAGELVAIVGQNGAGKSTLLNLLAQIFPPTSGRILLDGLDVSLMGIEQVRRLVTVLLQRPTLFSMTLQENIRLGAKATCKEVTRVAEVAGLGPLIQRCKDGLDVKIGVGGISLSGGEAQRIAIARSLLQKRPIVLLDEATSAIDPEHERSLVAMLRAELRQSIVLAVTHRPEIAKMSDRVLLLRQGRVIAEGRDEDLRASSQQYLRIWEGEDRRALSGSILRASRSTNTARSGTVL